MNLVSKYIIELFWNGKFKRLVSRLTRWDPLKSGGPGQLPAFSIGESGPMRDKNQIGFIVSDFTAFVFHWNHLTESE
jgi:hypothetical protein